MTDPISIANVSGFFGDRISAAREMVDAHLEGRAHIDVLTGDWLAELTMGLLAKLRDRDPAAGYATTFVRQLTGPDGVLADCLDAGIRIVANAGGLNPTGCAEAITIAARAAGREVRVAVVTGDDVTGLVTERRDTLTHFGTGEFLDGEPVVAHAYLGTWGIVEALTAGADVVVTGRVTDAAVVVAPAAWHHGWERGDLDALAGAVAAGHVIECGAQATGGNFSFVAELGGMARAGLPIAEIAADGSSVITKPAGTGGAVIVETVTAQLLYEIDGPRYLGPDVVARFDTLTVTEQARDRVRIAGAAGEPPPATVKVGAIVPAGWHNEVTFVLTGLDVEAKAALAQEALWAGIPGGRDAYDHVAVRLIRADRENPSRMTDAVSLLTVTVAGTQQAVGRLSRAATETALSSYAGFFSTAPPGPGSAANGFWPTLLPAADVPQQVAFEGRTWTVPSSGALGLVPVARRAAVPNVGPDADPDALPVHRPRGPELPTPDTLPSRPSDFFASRYGPPDTDTPGDRSRPSGRTVRRPLGHLVGARSGDKGGNATLGLWARTDEAYAWLAGWWDGVHVRWLLGDDAAECAVRLWTLPHVRAVGVTVVGFLGRGVGEHLALDKQAKGLGEFVRARYVDVPEELVGP